MHPYQTALAVMEATLRDYEDGMERPVPFKAGMNGKILRLPKQDIYHAMLLKLVAMLSALNAAYLLACNGHVLEQAAIERIADEASEDVTFLALGAINGTTDLHNRFLAAFWAEEFDDFNNTSGSHRSREMVPRRKIRSHIHSVHPHDPSTGNQAANIIAKAYSGYVHAAAPHIMEVYGLGANRFSVTGMLGTPRAADYAKDLWNYLYRGFIAFITAAKAFGSEEHVEALSDHLQRFQEATNRQN